jgi:HEAT repeat protein
VSAGAYTPQTRVEALAKIGGKQAVHSLQQAVQDAHPYVQQAAQEALKLLH